MLRVVLSQWPPPSPPDLAMQLAGDAFLALTDQQAGRPDHARSIEAFESVTRAGTDTLGVTATVDVNGVAAGSVDAGPTEWTCHPCRERRPRRP